MAPTAPASPALKFAPKGQRKMWRGFSALPNYLGGKRRLRNISVRAAIMPPAVRMRHIKNCINGGIFMGDARIFQEDAMSWMPEQTADLVYLDPPYFGSSTYEANYWILDCVLAGHWLPKPTASPFNRRETALHSLICMFEAVHHVPLWIFSFADNPDGFSANQLVALIEDFDRNVKTVPIEHRWSVATTEDHYEQGAKELLMICRKPNKRHA